tara:strand:+ start:99 stop:1901 length:1803 start_codon:yes stop_codon:yes gene_type:complete
MSETTLTNKESDNSHWNTRKLKMTKEYGPQSEVSKNLHAEKYREGDESFKDRMTAIAEHCKDSDEHFDEVRHILYEQKFLPAGRIQSAVGSVRDTTAFNCFVSDTIPDSLDGIMTKLKEAAKTMQLGGGIGYDFSTLRPTNSRITSINSSSSGPLAFMDMYDAMCKTIMSAGHRRGAMMGVLRIDHPDVEEFIRAKREQGRLNMFNVSVGVTNEFMRAVLNDDMFDLRFDGLVYKKVKATKLWDEIMRSTWDNAEPGILFIDNINLKNNLHYCEDIVATNPCGEQPLPPYGACLLGSFNAVKYLVKKTVWVTGEEKWFFNYEALRRDIPPIHRMMDNIIDRTRYPLPQQEEEAKDKRRMGVGLTGLANAIEAMGYSYGSSRYIEEQNRIMAELRNGMYQASITMSQEKGSFPLYSRTLYPEGNFIKTLPPSIQEGIKEHGIRNSHLLSIAPTGTISLCADAISSGIEPVFAHDQRRIVKMPEGDVTMEYQDYGTAYLGVRGKKADDVTVSEHVDTLIAASKYVDSACSKTCNVGDDVTWEEFKDIYMKAWKGGASGCTTFRAAGFRKGILEDVNKSRDSIGDTGGSCVYDPITGLRTCDE